MWPYGSSAVACAGLDASARASELAVNDHITHIQGEGPLDYDGVVSAHGLTNLTNPKRREAFDAWGVGAWGMIGLSAALTPGGLCGLLYALQARSGQVSVLLCGGFRTACEADRRPL